MGDNCTEKASAESLDEGIDNDVFKDTIETLLHRAVKVLPGTRPSAYQLVEDKLVHDPELKRLDSIAENEKGRSITYWNTMFGPDESNEVDPVYDGEPSIRLGVEMRMLTASTLEKFSTGILRRVHAREFQKAVDEHRYDVVSDLLCREAVQQTALCFFQRRLGSIVEAAELVVKKALRIEGDIVKILGKDVKIRSLVVLISVVGAGFLTNRSSSKEWSEITSQMQVEVIKGLCVVSCSWMLSIPLCTFVDNTYESYIALRHNNSMSAALVSAAGYGLISLPLIRQLHNHLQKRRLVNELRARGLNLDQDERHELDFCHETFTCPLSLTPFCDPVDVHGHLFERKAIIESLQVQGWKHPLTRRKVMKCHITEPSREFQIALRDYLDRRRILILTHQQLLDESPAAACSCK